MLTISQSRNISVKFVTAKSRVVPIKKKLTIPRKELLGNFILAKSMIVVNKALSDELVINDKFYWTDSMITLSWIKAENKEFKTFVQNRVNSIRKLSNPKNWFYVNTKQNPADIITREKDFDLENCNLWWEGPSYLKSENLLNDVFVKSNESFNGSSPDPRGEEERKIVFVNNCTEISDIGVIIDVNRFGTLQKLLNVTAYVLRFVNNLQKRSPHSEIAKILSN